MFDVLVAILLISATRAACLLALTIRATKNATKVYRQSLCANQVSKESVALQAGGSMIMVLAMLYT